MVRNTKRAILDTFASLLNERPMDKITVTDIVETCGVNRNTFYYYFQDIYALLDELCRTEMQTALDGLDAPSSWKDAFFEFSQYAMAHKPAIYHVYNSVDHTALEKYLFNTILRRMRAFVKREAEGLDCREADVETLAVFYAAATSGILLQWLNNGMQSPPEPFITEAGRLLDGNIRYALEKAAQSTQKT